MVENNDHLNYFNNNQETLDINKLNLIVKTNLLWMILILFLINGIAYLYIRYTKNIYESASEIKLDIKNEASNIGIKNVIQSEDFDIVAGEIEIIKSKLFLNQVLHDSLYHISFFSVGRVLNEELFQNPPALVKVLNDDHGYYNTPISYKPKNQQEFVLSINDKEYPGEYGKEVIINDLIVQLTYNPGFITGDEVGYYFVINGRNEILNYLTTHLSAEPLNYNANTIRISFKDHNPRKAQAVLNMIDTMYLKYSNEQKNLANRQKINWLVNELKLIEDKMEGYENYFEDFTIKNRTTNLDDHLKLTLEAINQIDSQRFELTKAIEALNKYQTGLEKNIYTPGMAIQKLVSPSVLKNIELLSELNLQIEKLKLSYSEATFTYKSKQEEFKILTQNLKQQLSSLKNDLASRLKSLETRRQKLESDFASFPEKNTQFSKNYRFYKLYEELYLTLIQSKSQFEVAQAGTTPDFKILSPASLPSKPISPNRPIIFGIGFVASLVVNLFFIGVLYVLNNKITSLDDLEKLKSATVIGAIPATRYKDDNKFHIVEHPNSMASESIRSLRTNLDFFNASSNQKIITISSTVSGEGKSFIALNLGAVLALSKKKVILVDLDMRKHKPDLPVENIDPSLGVSTVLIKKHHWKDCTRKTYLENFDFLPAGPQPPNPSELLLNGEFNKLLTELKEIYDFIILDTPPVGLVTDGIMAMRKADLSIYVFRANYSKRDFLKNLHRIINLNKFRNVTTVLNALPTSAKTYGYGYYEENRRGNKIKTLLNV